MYILVRVIALCLFDAHARSATRSESSLWEFSGESQKLVHVWKQNGNISMAF